MIEEHPLAGSEGDYIQFRESGEAAKGSFRCSDCGYGVVVTAGLPPCPMCGGVVWEEALWSPFSRSPLL